MQLKISDDLKKKSPVKGPQEKGLLLARLLQKAVQSKMKGKESSSEKAEGDHWAKKQKPNWAQSNVQQPNPNESQSCIMNKTCSTAMGNQTFSNPSFSQVQVSQQPTQSQQKITQFSNESTFLKSKLTAYDEANMSFEDSLLIQPSFMTLEGDQVGEMLKFIYTEMFGEDKYNLDLRRYQQIQQNPDQYDLEPAQDFNKEGKMLENIIMQVRTLKSVKDKLRIEIKQLNKQLDTSYIKMQNQQKLIQQLQNQIQAFKSSNKIQQKPNHSYETLLQENQILHTNIHELQEENFILQDSLKRVENEFEQYQKQAEELKFKNDQKFQKIAQLQELVSLRDKQIDTLLFNIGQLEIQLNSIKEEVERKEKQYAQKQSIINPQQSVSFNEKYLPSENSPKVTTSLQMTPDRKHNDDQSSLDIKRLSTIKEQEEAVNITDFIDQTIEKVEKYIQTQDVSTKSEQTLHDTIEQLSKVIIQLRKVLAHKEKIILGYEKQIQGHEVEAQKFQAFITQLSSEIEVCQAKLAENNRKSEIMVNKKIQTEEKYFVLSNPRNQQENQTYNQELTLGQRQDGFIFGDKQPSIADQVDNIQRLQSLKQVQGEQKNSNIQVQKSQAPMFMPQMHQISHIMSKEQYWDEISVTLSQLSQTQELRDIRNLTKELSQAYDKIIALTYEVNNLKRLNSEKQCNNQFQKKFSSLVPISQN